MVVDPRRSETARAFEHLAITPDADAWWLLSLLNVIFEEGLEDAAALARQAERRRGPAPSGRRAPARGDRGPHRDRRRAARAPWRVTWPPRRDAAVYGRTGSCLGRNGTLVSFLLDALNVVTGNLDREGGAMFGDPPLDFEGIAHALGLATYDKVRSRVGDLPEVLGSLPASLMAKEITTPGPGQIRALFVSAGNPVLSVPNGAELEAAISELDLCVAIDLYVSDTARHADFVLPATTMYEREDFPLPFLGLFTTPYIQMTDAVIEPAGEARQEWEIIEDISKRIGIVPSSVRIARILGRAGIRLSPERLVDLLLRIGPQGDLFGLRRGGLSVSKLRRNPHGIVLDEHLRGGVLGKKVRHRDRRVHLDVPEIRAEAERLAAQNGARPGLPTAPDRPAGAALPQLLDAQRGAADARRPRARRQDPSRRRRHGRGRGRRHLQARLGPRRDRADRATHRRGRPGARSPSPTGGATTAAGAPPTPPGGANVNQLASSEPEDLERLAGMAFLNGIPVRLEAVAGSGEAERTEPVAVPAG